MKLIFAILLLILGVIVAVQGVKKLFEKNTEKAASSTTDNSQTTLKDSGSIG